MVAYAGIRQGTNLFLSMLKNFVRVRMYGLYARRTQSIHKAYAEQARATLEVRYS